MDAVTKFSARYPLVVLIAIMAVAGLVASILLGHEHVATWLVSGRARNRDTALQLKDMVQTLRRGSFGIDILAVTAIVSTVVVGEYWAALVVCLMLTGSEALEDFAEGRASAELTSLLERSADHRVPKEW